MPDPRPAASASASAPQPTPGATRAPAASSTAKSPDAVSCDRCGAEMFRMHAVWRCPSCGFKTDCCGW